MAESGDLFLKILLVTGYEQKRPDLQVQTREESHGIPIVSERLRPGHLLVLHSPIQSRRSKWSVTFGIKRWVIATLYGG
jgi:hypothetical protein